MPTVLRLKSPVTVRDLGAWVQSSSDRVAIEVGPEFQLAFATEGMALGVLAALGARIDLTLTFDWRTQHHALDNLFGLSLSFAAERIESPGGSSLRSSLWERVTQGHGQLGSGKKVVLVSRDPDAPIPSLLRSTDRQGFPPHERFRALLSRIARGMGGSGFGSSEVERDLSTFLYEAARNCHEHARMTKLSIRGLIAERLTVVVRAADAVRRTDVPLGLQDYVSARLREKAAGSLVLSAFTVVDVGPGIQNTLPADPGESPWNRLVRAFRPGQSRKPQSGLGRGEGLPKILDAAKRLRAFILLASDGLVVPLDCTQPDTSFETAKTFSLQKHRGTSVTLIWPSPDESPDQETFAFESAD